MNIIFLTMSRFATIDAGGIYPDLMRKFMEEGHKPYIVAPRERKTGEKTELVDYGNYAVLKVRVGNMSNVSFYEKGVSTVLLEKNFMDAINTHLGDVNFDLILYSTPPITFSNVIKKLKKKHNAKSYLMLKDIFPQNAVDLGMFSKKSILYRFFRKKEEDLYKLSDYIGCMSPANVDFVKKNNPKIPEEKIEICPNCIRVSEYSCTHEEKLDIKKKYNIPTDKKVFIYGGNLGKPQGIDFLIECLESQKNKEDRFFIIAGSGTDFNLIKNYKEQSKQENLLVLSRLSREDYDVFIKSCDVGMIFLDKRFTIPNFPSRLLTYMHSKLPVLSVTDANTDVGDVIEGGNFGWKCLSGNLEEFKLAADRICAMDNLDQYGENAYQYLAEHYEVSEAYNAIMKHF